jgi:hypothetical protein
MALDPRISLASLAPQVQMPNFVNTAMIAQQMQEQQQQQQLRMFQLSQLLRQQQQRDALLAPGGSLAQLLALDQGGTAPGAQPVSPLNPQAAAGPIQQTPLGGTPQASAPATPIMQEDREAQRERLYRQIMLSSPDVGGPIVKSLLDVEKMQRENQKARSESQSKQAETHIKLMDTINQGAQAVLDAPPAQQPARYQAFQQAVQGLPIPAAAQLPAEWGPEAQNKVALYAQQSRDAATRMKQQIDQQEANIKAYQAETARAGQRTGQQEADIKAYQAQTERGRLTEQQTIEGPQGIYAVPKYPGALDIAGGGTGEGASGVARPLTTPGGEAIGSPKAMEPMRQATADDLKKVNEGARTAQTVTQTLTEVERLMNEGIYDLGPKNAAAIALYQRTGTVAPNYDENTLARTIRLRQLGAQLTLSRGSLGSNVSNEDRETYGRSAGDFERGQTIGSMQESIKSMRAIAQKAIDWGNQANESVQRTGRLPAFESTAPPPRGTTANPLAMTDVDKILKAYEAKGIPMTRQQILDDFRKAKVPVR